MPRTARPNWQKLTYHKARRQWRKFRDGRYYYLGQSGVNKTDRKAHDQALAEWAEIEAAIDNTAGQDEAIIAEHAKHLPDEATRDLKLAEAHRNAKLLEAFEAEETRPAGGLTIDDAINTFLAEFRADVKLGTKSRSRHESLRAHLKRFADWTRDGSRTGGQPIDTISEQTLTGYRANLIDAIAAGDLAHISGRDAMMALRQFIRRVYEQNLLDRPPRNLDSRHLVIPVPSRKPKHLPTDQIKTLLANASTRTRLYMLLALNCGMTQKDIADLRRDEIDLRNGTLTRRRSKTAHHETTPEVAYRLWPATSQLLSNEANSTGEVALTNEKGGPLIREDLRPDGSLHRTDNIRTAYRRLVLKANKAAQKQADETATDAPAPIDERFKLLRKTGANLIEQHPTYKSVAGLYLAHAPQGTRERFYTAADEKLLAEATNWLGQMIGIASTTTRTRILRRPKSRNEMAHHSSSSPASRGSGRSQSLPA